jgi:hypothetical protein
MFRPLMLAAIAVGVGLFGASLLRTERRAALASPAEATCTARTRAGTPCSRPAEPGSDRCWQHG